MADLEGCIQKCLGASGRLPPRPPVAHLMAPADLAMLAARATGSDPGLADWMDGVGLKPHNDRDVLLAIAILLRD